MHSFFLDQECIEAAASDVINSWQQATFGIGLNLAIDYVLIKLLYSVGVNFATFDSFCYFSIANVECTLLSAFVKA